jgi:hypothetical protein
VRDRSDLPASARKIELISPEEIAAAIRQVLTSSFGMNIEAIPAATCRLLGFARTSDDMATVVRRIALKLAETGRLQNEEGHVTVKDGS